MVEHSGKDASAGHLKKLGGILPPSMGRRCCRRAQTVRGHRYKPANETGRYVLE